MPARLVSVAEPMETCHHNAAEDMDQWQSPGCIKPNSVVGLVVVMQYVEAEQCKQFLWKGTFIVVVFHSEDSPPGGTCVVGDGFEIQWFDSEGVNDPDRNPLW